MAGATIAPDKTFFDLHNRYVPFPADPAGEFGKTISCQGKGYNDTPAASRVRGGDRAGVVSSKTPAESVNGCANTLPVVFPVSGVRAANVAQFLNYLLLPFRANRGQQDPKRLLPIILL